MVPGPGTRHRALAAGFATALVLAGCSPAPESVPDRAPGPAGVRVSVSGDGVRGIRAEVLGWEPFHNNALPPERTIRVQARFLGEREWSLAGTTVELAACAVDGERKVVRCGTIGNYVSHPLDNPYRRDVEAMLTTAEHTDEVADVLLLPDQYADLRPSRRVDPRDGDDYEPPRIPEPGQRI